MVCGPLCAEIDNLFCRLKGGLKKVAPVSI